MKRKIGIISLIFILFFQNIIYGTSFPTHINAEELGQSILKNVTMTDQSGQLIDADKNEKFKPSREAKIDVHYEWAISNATMKEGDTFTFHLPLVFQINNEINHSLLTNNQTEIGTYHVGQDGQVTIAFNKVAESQGNVSGKLSIPVVFDPMAVTGSEKLPIVFDLNDKEQIIQVAFQSDVEAPVENKDGEKPSEDTEVVDQKEEKNTTNKAPALSMKAATATTQITENIITDVTLTNTENVEIKDGEFPDGRPLLGTEVGVHYKWRLPDGHGYGAGSTFEFQLPDEFELYNEIDGKLAVPNSKDVGTFKVTTDGKVTMTFNEEITTRSDISGELELWSIFSYKIQGSTNQIIEFPTESGIVTIPVHFQPKPGKAIDKSGVPDTGYNAKTIDWTIDINKQLDKITHAVVKDPIQEGQELQPDSIQVFELGINLDGSTTVVNQVGSEKYKIVKTTDGKDFELQFQDETLDKAYRIKYTTTITDHDKTSYSNTATLSGDNTTDIDATSTVSVGRGKPLEKKATEYKSLNQTIDWEIKYNYNEKTIAQKDAWLEDLFTDSHKLNGTFEVYKVTLDANGEEASSELVSNYTKTDQTADGKNGFKLQFNQDISSAYKIVYQTVTTKQVFDGETVINTVKSHDTEKKATQDTWQEILHKWDGQANYKDKTVNWTIALNRNNFNMTDGVLTDTFPNGGLGLIEGSFAISGLTRGVDYELEPIDKDIDTPWRSGYKVMFKKELTGAHTITYKTKFDNDWKTDKTKTGFDNHANMIWKDGSTSKEHSKDATATFNPDQYTVNNGFKNGSYNAQTKEITWGIGVNYNLKKINDAKVEDFILQGQKLVEGSLEVYEVELTGSVEGVKIGNKVAEDKYIVDDSIKDQAGNPGFRIDFGKMDAPYYVTYKTSLKDQLIVEKYENTATLFDGSDKLTGLKGSVSVQYGGEYVNKQAKQNGKLIDWTVQINRGQSKISNAKVTDTPSANLILLENSFHLYQTTVDKNGNVTKGEELTKDKDYRLEIKTDADEKQSFEISFLNDINSAYILEYQTFINAKNGDTVSNDVKLTGEQITTENTATSEKFAVKLSGGSGTGSGATGNLVVTKVDAADKDKLLPGATFTLYDSEGEIAIKTAKTDAEGKVTFKNLLYGDYLLKEDSAPEGYVVGIHKAGQVVTIDEVEVKKTVENKKIIRSVELTKMDDELSTILLPDAVYKLQYYNGTDFEDTSHSEIKTDANGKIVIDDLKPGDYRFIETKAPFGYELDATPIPFTIEADQTEVDKVSHTNKIMLGDVELTKVDEYDHKITLKDAEFELQDKDGKVIKDKLTTNEEGKLVVKDLHPGDYQFVETKAPADYELNTKPLEFTIVKGQTEMLKVNFENKLIPGAVELTKVHKGNAAITLKDAEFKLMDQDGKVIQEKLKTDDKGIVLVEDLRPGNYQFVETKAPAGYVLNTKPEEFTIDKSQKEMVKVTFENELIQWPSYEWDEGQVELTKVDKDDPKKTLEGAVFALKDQYGNTLKEGLTTDKNGKLVVKNLKQGTYKFVETKAPFGYEVNQTPVEFVIVNYQTETRQVSFTNELSTGAVELTKVDKDDKKLTLENAVFELQDPNEKVLKSNLSTNKEGKLLVTDLKPGDYQFVETKAPTGYVLDPTPLKFKIDKGQKETLTVTFENKTAEGAVELTKVDKDDKKLTLENAIFELQDLNGKVLKSNLSTNKEGKLLVTDLKPGDYQFVETKAPAGYILDQTPLQFTIKKGQGEAQKVIIKNKKQNEDGPSSSGGGTGIGVTPNGPNDNNTNGPNKNPSNSNGQGNPGNSNNQPDNDKPSDSKNKLPNTATNMYTWLAGGIALLFLAFILMLVTRRKPNQ
ncbi:SpaA isopeptide-forming pilin-related protein [Bacillus sp. REN10]|uniref:SpaA isopeptide-forming pilin-related protein n=1 Tax=Bacillus sp. REN10 TaxID=2782541 RepID=UPI00193C06C7|nr:SpaA isopeptide-forming pilin-related protein [Bacillus sp. REN10]